jgi:hypothetical protein
MPKKFKEDIKKIFDLLKSRIPFAFSKYADGEWSIIRNIAITVQHNEFSFDPRESFFREKLIESFKFKDDRYYVGISCPCCQGDEAMKMKIFSEQYESNLTFANLFVNSNYKFYVDNFIPEYKNWDVHLVANEKSDVDSLPFKVEKFYPVKDSAWKYNYELIEELNNSNISNKLFLFCCGPMGNVMTQQMWDKNKNNTYMDVGSTLNPWMLKGMYGRDYFNTHSVYANRECVWIS